MILLLIACFSQSVDTGSDELYDMGYQSGCGVGTNDACRSPYQFNIDEVTIDGEYSAGFVDGYNDCLIIWEELNEC